MRESKPLFYLFCNSKLFFMIEIRNKGNHEEFCFVQYQGLESLKGTAAATKALRPQNARHSGRVRPRVECCWPGVREPWAPAQHCKIKQTGLSVNENADKIPQTSFYLFSWACEEVKSISGNKKRERKSDRREERLSAGQKPHPLVLRAGLVRGCQAWSPRESGPWTPGWVEE